MGIKRKYIPSNIKDENFIFCIYGFPGTPSNRIATISWCVVYIWSIDRKGVYYRFFHGRNIQ